MGWLFGGSPPHCYGKAHLTNYAELRASKTVRTVDCANEASSLRAAATHRRQLSV